MAGRLNGKVVLISGIARGQGRSHAVRCAEEGAAIVGFDACAAVPAQGSKPSTEADLAETVQTIKGAGGKIMAEIADTRDRAAVAQIMKAGVAEFGRLDAVVANAGVTPPGRTALDIPQDEWQAVLDINLTGTFHVVTLAAQEFIAQGHGGSIIMTSSSLGLKPVANLAAYVASKAGMVGLMRTMAQEIGPYSIRINTVHPTAVGTDMLLNDANYKLFRPDLEHPTQEDALPVYRSLHVLPIPWIEAGDVTNAVVYLASDEARYVTGSTISVDAGMIVK